MKAEFSRSNNDLYWILFDLEDKTIIWSGYNDGFWWDTVSVSEQFQVQRGVRTGRIYRLDPRTNAVTVIQPAPDAGEKKGEDCVSTQRTRDTVEGK